MIEYFYSLLSRMIHFYPLTPCMCQLGVRNVGYNVGKGNDLVFGGIGNDIIFGGAGNDTVDGGDGNNLIYGDDGNDILGAGIGNDTLYGGSGIDIIDGGDGNNDIYGDRGNDYLTGGNGTNRLFGGGENDVLEGGTGLNLLKGTETNMMSGNEVDTLIGNPSARLNAFYIGDRAINWYSANGNNDYAKIVNFNPVTDIILGGVNIEAQNLITQTFLWAGGELIAKIEGLWASQLQFPVRIF
jgi:Ca2+-binding RTX toxin-like protein